MRKIIALNWKMNTIMCFKKYVNLLNENKNNEIFVLPSFLDFLPLKDMVVNLDCDCKIGVQDVSQHDEGAFTGEVSAKILSKYGVDACLVGHSERREGFNENGEIVSNKINKLQENSITPIYCIGESLSIKEAGDTLDFLEKQIINELNEGVINNGIIIAYEPIWSIGTGIVPTIENISDTIFGIQNILKNKFNLKTLPKILYGGSVNDNNSTEILSLDNVGGVLVGGASLDLDKLINIIN